MIFSRSSPAKRQAARLAKTRKAQPGNELGFVGSCATRSAMHAPSAAPFRSQRLEVLSSRISINTIFTMHKYM
jgi:hypothetical protein